MFNKALHRKFYIIQNVNDLTAEIPRLKSNHSHGLTQINLRPGLLNLPLTEKYKDMIDDDR